MPAHKKVADKRQARVDKMVDIMDEARVSGKRITTASVMAIFGISKPTAIETKQAAEAIIAKRTVDHAHNGIALTPPVGGPMMVGGGSDQVIVGIDITLELSRSSQRLRQLSGELQSQLSHATYFILGCPEGHEFPGLCVRCGEAEVAKLSIRNQPRLLQIGYLDIAKLAEAAVKTEMAAKSIVDSYDDKISKFYSYQALEKFVNNVYQAVETICPEHRKALADEIRRLQAANVQAPPARHAS